MGVGSCRCLLLRHRKAHILLDCSLPLHAWLCARGAPSTATCGGPRAPLEDLLPFIQVRTCTCPCLGAFMRPHFACLRTEPPPRLCHGEACMHVPPAPRSLHFVSPEHAACVAAPLLLLRCCVLRTALLQLLAVYEVHAALVTTPESLLALPYLARAVAAESAAAAEDGSSRVQGVQPPAAAWQQHPEPGAGTAAAAAAVHAGSQQRPAGCAYGHMLEGHIGPIKGPIYATQAVLDTAMLMAVERQAGSSSSCSSSSSSSSSASSHSPGTLPTSIAEGLVGSTLPHAQHAVLQACWRRASSLGCGDEQHALELVRPVRYGQVVPIDGHELTAVAYPSGSGFGHCVWVIMDGSTS